MSTGLKPVWAGCTMRLDPFCLPQAVSYATSDEFGEVSFTIDQRGAVVRRTLERSGLPVTIMLPAHCFNGVAARAIEDEYGEVTVTLELMHEDSALCVPLLVARDLEDIAIDWRAWAESYKLPMLIVEGDGIARTLEDSLRGSRNGPTPERRLGQSTAQRRPRFLARRKPGDLGLRLVVSGEEIIARD